MDEIILNVSTLPEPLHRRIRSPKVRVREENGEIILTPILNIEITNKTKEPKRKLGFVKGSPLPDSFFDPLPEEELQAWGL